MPKFKCKYEKCAQFDKEQIVAKVRFSFDTKQNKMVLTGEYRCPECNNLMEYVPEEETAIKGFNVNKFEGLPTHEKRKIIHKRSMEHFKKHDKGDLANYKKKIIDDNKKMVGGK